MGAQHIWYANSLDAGLNWQKPVQISEAGQDSSWTPSLAVQGGLVSVAWANTRHVEWQIILRQSSDNGVTWLNQWLMSNALGDSYNESMCSSGDSLYLTWVDNSTGVTEVYFKRSLNGGNTWWPKQRLTTSLTSDYPKIAVNGSTIHLAFMRVIGGGNPTISYLRSTDAGETWEQSRQLSSSAAYSWAPSLAVLGDKAFIVWSDYRNGFQGDIYGTYSDDDGSTWTAENEFFPVAGDNYAPSFAASETGLHLLWSNDRSGVVDVYYAKNSSGLLTSTLPVPVAGDVVLEQNYPNPFNPATTIRYQLPAAMLVNVSVLDGLGRPLQTLKEGYEAAGTHVLRFDGAAYPSGHYTIVLRTPTAYITRSMTLIK